MEKKEKAMMNVVLFLSVVDGWKNKKKFLSTTSNWMRQFMIQSHEHHCEVCEVGSAQIGSQKVNMFGSIAYFRYASMRVLVWIYEWTPINKKVFKKRLGYTTKSGTQLVGFIALRLFLQKREMKM